jgi:hypothetical protein
MVRPFATFHQPWHNSLLLCLQYLPKDEEEEGDMEEEGDWNVVVPMVLLCTIFHLFHLFLMSSNTMMIPLCIMFHLSPHLFHFCQQICSSSLLPFLHSMCLLLGIHHLPLLFSL